ncbi:phage holin family protein [Olivibacter sitiensis]|uniref:phage holin family protein n=1 Tax=Olivibacter sitiensis TaxID=376470 RepID=UPI000686B501|nr:phage holin family protein [Olivibacter sitiensis]
MENEKFSLKGVIHKLKEYIQTNKDLFVLQSVERLSQIVPVILLTIVKLVFAFFLLVYLSISLALFLGELMNSYALGFLVTGAVFFLLIILLSLFGGAIKRSIGGSMVNSFLRKWNEGGNNEK